MKIFVICATGWAGQALIENLLLMSSEVRELVIQSSVALPYCCE